jgi:hypothetical protein
MSGLVAEHLISRLFNGSGDARRVSWSVVLEIRIDQLCFLELDASYCHGEGGRTRLLTASWIWECLQRFKS